MPLIARYSCICHVALTTVFLEPAVLWYNHKVIIINTFAILSKNMDFWIILYNILISIVHLYECTIYRVKLRSWIVRDLSLLSCTNILIN